MSAVYVVQGFTSGKRGRMQPDSPVQARSIEHAKRVAERLAERKALVVAFMRESNQATGEYEDAKLIVAHGNVPDEIMEMPRA